MFGRKKLEKRYEYKIYLDKEKSIITTPFLDFKSNSNGVIFSEGELISFIPFVQIRKITQKEIKEVEFNKPAKPVLSTSSKNNSSFWEI